MKPRFPTSAKEKMYAKRLPTSDSYSWPQNERVEIDARVKEISVAHYRQKKENVEMHEYENHDKTVNRRSPRKVYEKINSESLRRG